MKRVGDCGGKGSWERRWWLLARQLRASTSRWAVVNSRYQVRTGCYQTFKAESIRLLLQQGKGERRCYQNPKTLLIFIYQSPLTKSGVASQLSWTLPSVILRRMQGIFPFLHLSSALCIPKLGFWLEMKLSVSFSCSEHIQSDCKGCCFHPERVDIHMRTA